MSVTIQPGSRVVLHYTLSFPDEQFIESTKGGEPVSVAIGSGDLATFLEERLLGLAAGEQRRFEIAAHETQLTETAESVQLLARSDFPPELALTPGMAIGFQGPQGEEVPGVILEVNANDVRVDFSHPLAGRDLVFEVEILEVTLS